MRLICNMFFLSSLYLTVSNIMAWMTTILGQNYWANLNIYVIMSYICHITMSREWLNILLGVRPRPRPRYRMWWVEDSGLVVVDVICTLRITYTYNLLLWPGGAFFSYLLQQFHWVICGIHQFWFWNSIFNITDYYRYQPTKYWFKFGGLVQ